MSQLVMALDIGIATVMICGIIPYNYQPDSNSNAKTMQSRNAFS